MLKKDPFTTMMSLKTDFASLGNEKISINKAVSKINREAREKAKAATCCVCGKSCTSFCNSHSIPEFSLRHIAEGGKICQVLQGEMPMMGDDTGLNSAGTFHLICHDCDNSIFQDYENPDAYSQPPSDRILAQIATKDELHMISKRKHEIELYCLMEQQFDNFHSLGAGKSIEELDLTEYLSSLQYAMKTLSGKQDGRYNLCFYRLLDYVVPVATQSSLCLVGDFEDGIINNIYNFSEQYHTPSIHVAVFPLEKTSIVLLFVENGIKRYRKFIRQLSKLDPEDQLAAINYMVFSYTENTFLCPSTYNRVKKNNNFMEVCRRTTNAVTAIPLINPIDVAIEEFSFSKRNTIPNLLSREYALKVE